MKRKLTLAVSYCIIAAMAVLVATSCKKSPINNGEEPKPDDTSEVVVIVPAISLFSADSTVLGETLTFEVDASTQKFIVDASVKGWKAEITGNDVGGTPWLTCEPLTGPTGRTEVTVAVTANDIELERTGSITFTQDSTELTKVVNIVQKGLPPMETDITTDSLALVAIYNAFDGKVTMTYWDLKKPVKSWKGVTVGLVNDKPRVIALDITNSDAKGDIPAEMGNLRELTSLIMTVNRVKGVIPNGLSLAKNMKKLNLRGSWGITGIPKEMGLWADLEELDIEGTSVAELPSSLGKCAKLQYINASQLYEKAKVKMKGDVSKALANKPAMKYMKFGVTELTGNLSFLKDAVNLTKIEIEANRFSGDINLTEYLDYPQADSIRILQLGSSPELTGTLKGLNKLDSLDSFTLTDSKIGGTLDDMQLHTLKNVNAVTLTNNEITGNISIDFINALKTNSFVDLNKLSGTLAPEVVDQLFFKFLYEDRVCVQKQGFGFTNCVVVAPDPK